MVRRIPRRCLALTSDPHTAECLGTGMGMITWIRASMPESRETVFRPASGGGLRMVIDASKLDSFVQPCDHQAELANVSNPSGRTGVSVIR